jgi:hypothetical protein
MLPAITFETQTMALTNHKRFLELFAGSDVACSFGVPDPSARKGMRYVTERQPADMIDVERHFHGERSIVQIPLRGELCRFGVIDWDGKPGDVAPRLLPGFYRVPSKTAPGIHDFVFFEDWKPAGSVRQLLRDASELMGIPGCEVFPKQNSARFGNGINLPFFGDEKTFELFRPEFCLRPLPEVQSESPEPGSSDDEGYWDNDALLAMLSAYKEFFPGFEFRPCRHGFAVPCPGDLDGWGDGSQHTIKAPGLSHETLVFLKNGWPKFLCVHAHCNGECGSPKKTINDWRAYWDEFRLWEFEDWQEAEMAKRGDYVR